MKILMIYCDRFAYTPQIKTLEEVEDKQNGESFEDCLLAMIQAEAKDEADLANAEKKLVKNLKWAAKKNNTMKVILHSFAHLSESKAEASFTIELFNKVEARLKNADYETYQTAFGYFMDLDIKAPGVSQARIFKAF